MTSGLIQCARQDWSFYGSNTKEDVFNLVVKIGPFAGISSLFGFISDKKKFPCLQSWVTQHLENQSLSLNL